MFPLQFGDFADKGMGFADKASKHSLKVTVLLLTWSKMAHDPRNFSGFGSVAEAPLNFKPSLSNTIEGKAKPSLKLGVVGTTGP